MATQYPLQSKAFTWLLSALNLLSRIPYSVYTHANAVALFATFASDATSIKTHYKTSKHLPCSPVSMQLPEHAFECTNQAKSTLINLNIHHNNTHATAANDTTYENSFERGAA